MIFAVLDQLQSNPSNALISLGSFVVALVLAITVHEFSHAVAATLLGDLTPRRDGRVSLNPRAHLDPLGSVMILFAGFGWGKPVVVNPQYLRSGARSGMAVVALAGPLSNIAAAVAAAVPFNAGLVGGGYVGFSLFGVVTDDLTAYLLGTIVFFNLVLAAFNLIPLVPLDGFKVALGFLPREAARGFAQLERYGPAPLLLLVAVEYLMPGVGIIGLVVRPIINGLATLVLGGQLWT